MGEPSYRGTLLNISLLEERYSGSIFASIAIHIGIVLFFFLVPYLLPRPAAIQIGTGPGGGSGGEVYTVGVVDELAGGTGMTKPSLIPEPPALPESVTQEKAAPQAVPLPNTIEPKKPPRKADDNAAKKEVKLPPNTNVIPTVPRPGAGGTGGMGGGSGGGHGGGIGISIGSGSGGLAESWYARTVENRISRNWIKPAVDLKYEVVFSFYIAGDGSIYNIQKEKSSGNLEIDLTAESAIRASNPLTPPPPEFRGTPVQFVAQFAN